ncbi:unnamed protein product [Lactuca saligna]|uniref:Receptor-like serine/threonine-protein kinase n=1 Tax=Lactuca saligna TaxID=75948 RepID=A0AA36EDH9_LACSI|nr:unnamed protein product [Lactuca saligna]
MRAPWLLSFLFALFLIFSSSYQLFGTGVRADYSSIDSRYSNTVAIYSVKSWTNDESFIQSTYFEDGSRIRAILLEEDRFACGFFCNGTCTSYLFAIIIKPSKTGGVNPAAGPTAANPAVIWSANRDNPVSLGAILSFTEAGGLVLEDIDGSIVWTANIMSTEGSRQYTMTLSDNGNLLIHNYLDSMVWQSFDNPTDCLVDGQKLLQGQKLIPSVSSSDWTSQKDLYSLQVTNKGLFAYVESNPNPPQVYYCYLVNGKNPNKGFSHVELHGGLFFFISSAAGQTYPDNVIPMPQAFAPGFPLQYVKLMPDGHLKAFGWKPSGGVGVVVVDLLTGPLGDCFYPLVCGRKAICSANHNQSCSCPGTDSFKAVNESQPNMGCSHVTPLTCNATQHQYFIELMYVTYFTYSAADMEDVDKEICKEACLNTCSWKAAIFNYGSNSSSGTCYLPSELFTLTEVDVNLNSSAFIKVQTSKRRNHVATILGATIASLVLVVFAGFTMFTLQKNKKKTEIDEEYLDQLPGMPTRFSYEELKIATENFSTKLGEGGFGSVFEGTIKDGSRIAVKCLHGLVQVKKSFLAEVESIGSIHHVNLVRLRGFCAWSSQRFLVYEFMNNGSLDQWIYYGDRKHVLTWDCRRKIILDIAKGLAYLHQDCRQKIIHLDIKPQNILLDVDFNAKVSDFGLSKLIDRDQSQMITTMRGTPGYLAPEWLGSIITEKVDVYSFGILLLEILCGRKNFDRSQPEESWHLLRVFQSCWEQGTLLSIVDRYSQDMQVYATEVMEMMKMASWCLQTDFTKRPSMSSVVKVLEGVTNIESNLDYNFLYPKLQKITDKHEKSSKPVLPSILSGPRYGSELTLLGFMEAERSDNRLSGCLEIQQCTWAYYSPG